jgi:hypothetical protein
MAITYPLALPSTQHFSRVTMSASAVVGVSRSALTLTSQVQEHQGQLWQAGITLRPMKRADAEQWLAFFLSLNGRLGTFLLYDPAAPNPRGALGGTPLVDGGAQIGQELNTKGWTPSATGVLLAGDYFSLGTGVTTRLYKVLKDVDADGGGLATIDIWPRLRETPANSDPLAFTQAKGTFRLQRNLMSWDVTVAQFYGLGFSAEEAL